ncbi:hypothetical protein [Halegenticoccus soli]|uniref:hypothetical protein n=1 Tax=Halegenticoccus soli TaxID=1985678 RepID=UPI000C6EF121|nr:hypothetical protein [Halegenticoccus soli]
MTLYERVADLPLRIEDEDRTRHARDVSSGFRRATTVFALSGAGETGRGEDVTYDAEDHDALAGVPPFDLAGEYTVASFSERLDGLDLFPTKPPERESSRHYRRWALESAALDLALRQADATLGEAVGRDYDPVRFVVSTRLGEPPSTDRVDALLDGNPDLEFKLDPTSDWTDGIVADLAATGAVRILDLKGQYRGTEVDQDPDPELYDVVFEGFPDAVVEDPALTDETEPIVAGREDHVSWDAPITGVESVEELPFEPRWLNVKPSRFGSVESLFETLEYCEERGVRLYGGGQFELDVGRSHVQALASLFYPDGPNDVAPGAYNDPEVAENLPGSPLSPPAEPRGLAF